jgi:UDP-N-acetylmuramyl tripeptide synthase
MSKPRFTSIAVGKAIKLLSHFRGNGSALPGYIVERIDPGFIHILDNLPRGVVVISGTNGKTTTTKIVSELLASAGLRVFTNNTGSNFVRGVISSAISAVSWSGDFPFDIAVLELDEAHAVRFIEQLKPRYSLLLNVARDQLDRFGEIDHTAKLLELVAQATTNTVVINREDPRLARIKLPNAKYYGLSSSMRAMFPDDDNLLATQPGHSQTKSPTALVSLIDLDPDANTYSYRINNKKYSTPLQLSGIYNAYNAAGALAICHTILPEYPIQQFIDRLAEITSAFGRGETFSYNGRELELLLVKNPSAFQLSLKSFVDRDHDYIIAINDNFADGRDMSWLWNVDFTSLQSVAVTTGIRGADMALRLQYDSVPVGLIEPDLGTAIQKSLDITAKPIRIFATYTSMLSIRKILNGKSIL